MSRSNRASILESSTFALRLAFVACSASSIVRAQNLVPNPSFETHTSCPTALAQLALAVPWTPPTQGTSDHLHACATGAAGVPVNFIGSEPAHLGVGYAGLLAYYPGAPFTTEYREYIEAPLLAPLISGRCYRVSFWVSLADVSHWSCDGLGARLHVGSVGPVLDREPLPHVPQVQSATGVQLDATSGWTRIQSVVRAAGGEDHIVIGNFRDNAGTTIVTTPGGMQPYSYYYVDDVSVQYSPDCPCESAWGQAIGMPGLPAEPSTLSVLDLDGLSPGLPALFAGGDFPVPGGMAHVMTWDGATWSAFGPLTGPGALNGTVRASALYQGALYVAGSFSSPSTGIARWNPSLQEWTGVAGGLDSGASALQVFQGKLHVGGDFVLAGGVGCAHVARFDGSTWSPLGAGLDGPVRAFALGPDAFTTALYVGGEFTATTGGTPGSLAYIARWNGGGWGSVGAGMDAPVRALLAYDDGSGVVNPWSLYAGGDFTTAGGQACARVAALEWPATWHPLGAPGAQGTNGPVHALAAFDPCGSDGPFLIAGGAFTSAAGTSTSNVARFALGTWADLDAGTAGTVSALTIFDDGSGRELVVGGSFTQVGQNQTAARIATWRGCFDDCGGKRRPRYLDSIWPVGAAVVACTSYGPTAADPALQVIDLSPQGSAPVGANWLPDRFSNATWSIGQLGEIYGVVLDDSGNLFAAHSTVFGHPSVSQDRLGAAGLPGVVYRIDTRLGLPQILTVLPNLPDPSFVPALFVDSHPGLGDLAWDCEHHRLFVSNFEDGIVYALDPETGDILDLYDHGAPDGGAPGFVVLGERVWALATNVDRLFYGVMARDLAQSSGQPNEIWSVALGAEGRMLAGTAQLEITLSPASCPPAGLTFSPSGSLFVATACTFGNSYLVSGGTLIEYRKAAGVWMPSTSTSYQPGLGTLGGVDCMWEESPSDRVWTSASIEHTATTDVDGPLGLPALGGNASASIWIDLDADPAGLGRTPADLVVSCPQPIPIIGGIMFCAGDGTWTACPCGNSGATGRGCASSINASGAGLITQGSAVLSADTFTLSASGMPNSSALYFQGTTASNGGLGMVFGDGLRCAGGSVTRLGTKTNVAGSSQYPGAGDASVSVRGGCTPGSFRTYQVWYRNAAAFCTAATFNLTNGVSVTWGA